jgi:exosortase
MNEAPPAVSALAPGRAGLAAWLGAGALAALAWHEALRFLASEGSSTASVEHVFFDAAENPPWLIALVAIALLASRRGEVRAAARAPGSPWQAAALLAPGLVGVAWGRFTGAPDLALFGAIAMAIGALLLAFGAPLARLVAPPLALLAFAAPAPGVLVNAIVYPLQLVTADYAAALVYTLGIPAVQTADVIRTVSHAFLVIEGCSGLGSMEVLTLLALAWAWVVNASWWRTVVLALAAPAIAFGLNGLRVLALILAPDSPWWSGHTTQGVITFAIGSLCIAILDRPLEARDPRAHDAAVPVAGAVAARPPRALFVWLAAGAVASLLVPRYEPPMVQGPPVLVLPPAATAPWQATDADWDELYLGAVKPRRRALLRYEVHPAAREAAAWGTEPVTAMILEGDRTVRNLSILSRKPMLPGRGWRAVEIGSERLPYKFDATRIEAVSADRRALSRTIVLGLGNPFAEGVRALSGIDRSPLGRPPLVYVIRLSTGIARESAGLSKAERRLREVLIQLRPSLENLRDVSSH